MPITLEQAKQLNYGDMLHLDNYKNADGTPARLRVNGKVKTWKRDPKRIKVPVKHGLYNYGEVTNGSYEGNSISFTIDEVSLGNGLE